MDLARARPIRESVAVSGNADRRTSRVDRRSGVVLYAFARTIGVRDVPAALLALAYLISPSVQGFAYNDFSEAHFEPILIFALAIAAARRSFWWTLAFAQLPLGVKEDAALFLVWFGIAGALWFDRRIGASVAVLAAVNAIAYRAILWAHGAHASIPQYGWRILYPPQDLAFLIEILVPFAFAPLFLRWRVLLALPLVAEALFGGEPRRFSNGARWDALHRAADCAVRARRRRRNARAPGAFPMGLGTLTGNGAAFQHDGAALRPASLRAGRGGVPPRASAGRPAPRRIIHGGAAGRVGGRRRRYAGTGVGIRTSAAQREARMEQGIGRAGTA